MKEFKTNFGTEDVVTRFKQLLSVGRRNVFYLIQVTYAYLSSHKLKALIASNINALKIDRVKKVQGKRSQVEEYSKVRCSKE